MGEYQHQQNPWNPRMVTQGDDTLFCLSNSTVNFIKDKALTPYGLRGSTLLLSVFLLNLPYFYYFMVSW